MPKLLAAFNEHGDPYRNQKIIIYSGLMIFITLMAVVFVNCGFFLNRILALRLRVSTSGLIFRKTYLFLHRLWLGPIQAAIIFYLMCQIDTFATLCGIGVMIIFVPIMTFIASLFAKVRYQISLLTDRRLRVISDIVLGMKILKFFAWEDVFLKMVTDMREEEMRLQLKSRYLQSHYFTTIIYQLKVITLTLITAMVLRHSGSGYPKALQSFNIFTLLSYLYSIHLTMVIFLPIAAQSLGETLVGCRRIQDFLKLPEHSEAQKPKQLSPKQCPALRYNNFTACWHENSNQLTLKDVNVSLEGPKLVVIVGSVGSSKTSLLLSAFGELPARRGGIEIAGSIAYVPQLPWIYPGTIRDNILNFLPFDETRYRNVLKATTLDVDIERMQSGDSTQVGERGIALSGGQKARIGLARAAYSPAEILLLDDPLAAVDARVGNVIFDACIGGLLSGRLRLLVTNQHQYLPGADSIVVMNKGQIHFQGSYQALLESDIELPRDPKEEDGDAKEEEATIESAFDKMERGEEDCATVDECEELVKRLGSSIGSPSSMHVKVIDESPPAYELIESMDHIDDEGKDSHQEEAKQEGAVEWKHYLTLGRIGGGVTGIVISFLLYLGTALNWGACDIFMSYWVDVVDKVESGQDPGPSEHSDAFWSLYNSKASLIIYASLTISLIVVSTIRSIHFFNLMVKSATRIHNLMIRACLLTRLSFFEKNTSGRIMNRFSKDIGMIDDQIPNTMHEFFQGLFTIFASILVSVVASPWVIPAALIFPVVCIYIRRYYLNCSREIKRLEANARSPLYSWVNVTLQGLPCVRAANFQDKHLHRFNHFLNKHSSVVFMNEGAVHWLGVRIDLACAAFVTCVIVISDLLGIYSNIPASQVGLMITSVMMLLGLFPWCIQQSAELENQMVAVERAMEYSSLEPESTDQAPIITTPPRWPSKGLIQFQNLWLRYDDDAPFALKGANLMIQPTTKVGIVGRTGAGKSSLISALFRLVEPTQGRILIDGVDISRLDLHQLRQRLGIISQDPVMFTGTLRCNLDPEGKHSDDELWHVLELVQMRDEVELLPNELDAIVSECGTNFSTGQRQLFTLARAILTNSRILIFDEATANVDPKTDNIIQKIIRTEFGDRTVLTVAHRLHTVVDYDIIVVMDGGELIEIGQPHALLNPEQAKRDHHRVLENVKRQGEELGISADETVTTPKSSRSQEAITGSGPLASLVKQTGPLVSRQLAQSARLSYLQMTREKQNWIWHQRL